MYLELLVFLLLPFAIASSIYLAFRRVGLKKLEDNKIKETLDYCIRKANISHFQSYEFLMDSFYSDVTSECNEFDALFKKLRSARNYKKKSTETGIGILDALNSFLETPNQDRFEKVDSLYHDLKAKINMINFSLKRLRDTRIDFRNLAVEEMEGISLLVDCFSNELAEADVKLERDAELGNYSLAIYSDNLRNMIEATSNEAGGIGLSLIESGSKIGGIGGIGVMALGAVAAAGEFITAKAEREAKYAEGVAQRVKDIKELGNAKERALAFSNELYELTTPLKQCHKIYIAELENISSSYESGVDEKLIASLIKLSSVYNALNKNVATGE